MKYLLLLILSITSLQATSREFTDIKGRKVTAEYLGTKENKAGLKLSSGKTIYYPLDKLSPADNKYIKNHILSQIPSIEIPHNALYPTYGDSQNPGHYLTHEGKKVEAKFSSRGTAPRFVDGYAKVTLPDKDVAFIGYEQKILLKASSIGKITFVGNYSDSLILCQDRETSDYGYVNHKGRWIIPAQYKVARAMKSNRAWVLTKPVTPDQNKNIALKPEDLKPIPSIWHLIDQTGKTITTIPEESEPKAFEDGMSLVLLPEGVIANDKLANANRLINPTAVYFNQFGEQPFVSMDLKGQKTDFIDGVAFLRTGMINKKGQWIVSENTFWNSFNYLDRVHNHTFIARPNRNGPFKLYSTLTGKAIHTYEDKFLDLRTCGDGLVSYSLKGSNDAGIMTLDGQFITKPIFRSYFKFKHGFALVFLKGEGTQSIRAIINRSGKVLWKANKPG